MTKNNINSLTEAWKRRRDSYFVTREGKAVGFVQRLFNEDGVTLYEMTDGAARHVDGSVFLGGTKHPQDIVRFTNIKSRAATIIIDARLMHLRKKVDEAQRDLRKYIQTSYPEGSALVFNIGKEVYKIKVTAHYRDKVVGVDVRTGQRTTVAYDRIDSRMRKR